MSFGQHEYQHRFYRNEPHKKLATQPTSDSRIQPISNYHQDQYYTPQIVRHAPQNPLNLRVRAGEIGYNEPGWEGYKLKSYILDKYGQNYRNYQSDRDTIEKFKRQAEEQKRRRRFGDRYGHQQHSAPPVQQYQHYLPEIRMKTQSPQIEHYDPLPAVIQNPQRYETDRYDVGIMARVRSRQDDKKHSSTGDDERRRLREYRRKYSKLKNRLKEQLNLQKKEERSFQQQKEKRNMSRIERLMTDVSQRIAKNTLLLNEGLRVQQQLRQMKQQPTPEPIQSKVTMLQSRQHPNEIHYSTSIEQMQTKPPSPRIVYAHKQLNQSYHQLQRLKTEISTINQQIERKYKQL